MFPAQAERAKALSIWGAVAAGGSAAGVLIGGLLAGGLGWPSVFLINVPVGGAVLATVPMAAAAVVAAAAVIAAATLRRHDATEPATV